MTYPVDGVTALPEAYNEPVREYRPGGADARALRAELTHQLGQTVEIPSFVNGRALHGGGRRIEVRAPHDRSALLGVAHGVSAQQVNEAVDAAVAAAPVWRELPFDERAAIFLRAAELLAGPWRARLNAATMLGQSKSVQQAEIDSACELIDFWRYNVSFARQLLTEQPESSPGVWNRTDHRPLEGFVYAVTPFNFTAIAGNLPTAPALMGNTVVWKPAATQLLAAHWTMELLREAGLPDGVINLVVGDAVEVTDVVLSRPELAGIHFTGSTTVFRGLWQGVAANLETYRAYPRLIGETGGKDFVVAHPSADPAALRTALVRGAFEFQGQKCSAASRAYLPRSLWTALRDELAAETEGLSFGDVADFTTFGGAVIDERAFRRLDAVISRSHADDAVNVIAGGRTDDSQGWFVRPTIVECADPRHDVFATEYFGPFLSVYVYDDADYSGVLDLAANTSPYGLTGAIFSRDRHAVVEAMRALRFAAGNFYVNDKPTGAVVGQQPFGGGRASGTNDKAGSVLNLQRWVSPRSIKETFVPPHDHRYPHMAAGE
ncbi:delta-1-pyrroline-5-carboxylate dehydrogenase [Streptoalloteichus hindustanus]|uniref:L-glutamate gamma-semialdehyde dehydrogenase n=1 Tax=Streptoalloteichus hindustanus TaxID=2017 RepID=A0A1M4Z4P1_STRHI|nr:delta-1-pyrroline-5-carboxylate dehydrogenase [Streptoalloteichus hindustanus]